MPHAEESGEKPRPMIFALMRNGHEVLRTSQAEMRMTLEKKDIETWKKQWADFSRWQEIHLHMEEGNEQYMGMFRILDKYRDNVATKAGLLKYHEDLHKFEVALDDAVKGNKDMEAVTEAFKAFMDDNLHHLIEEEKVMMPQVQAIAKGGTIGLKELMVKEILPMATEVEEDKGKFFVQYALAMLEKYPEGMPRARVFAHALWAASTKEEWEVRSEWCKEALSMEKANEIAQLCEIWDPVEAAPEPIEGKSSEATAATKCECTIL